jgi:tRNA(Ile)-lysidine synthase
MASSKKPLSNKVSATTPQKTKPLSLLDVVEKSFVSLSTSHKKMKSMTVALSGGVDSVVLLHLIHQLQKTQTFTLKASMCIMV